MNSLSRLEWYFFSLLMLPSFIRYFITLCVVIGSVFVWYQVAYSPCIIHCNKPLLSRSEFLHNVRTYCSDSFMHIKKYRIAREDGQEKLFLTLRGTFLHIISFLTLCKNISIDYLSLMRSSSSLTCHIVFTLPAL